ncbi:hypothetical protein PF005_g7281 [Phytophthora fragariae]|uniref:Secreted protein n=1 Tax=Phytophthora fragariae TaxID=53985 RepID=A0A6A3LGR6_9STRA|nr:hypothetical protein PF003_g13906 [Phytophthora fragariae]KAE9018562.1 hypothetical protein PF011_g6194 [Phytophthora fragariae]KAE9077464.1 hypothetical protein PF010_g23501 [Phytophthora fragariae]KAE9121584.1 hypothetical protein PF007_g7763 [Phytophthora fragariae]KAE9148915.1 hypothetical protein PF006_g6541 [Phytophthora fragariae]
MPRMHSTGIAPAGALLSSMLPLGGSVDSGNAATTLRSAVCWKPLQLDAAVQRTCCQPWCLNTSHSHSLTTRVETQSDGLSTPGRFVSVGCAAFRVAVVAFVVLYQPRSLLCGLGVW